MSTSTIEAKKEIINKAPKGATHYILLQHDLWEAYAYARLEGAEFKMLNQGEWVTQDDFDLNEIGLYDLQSLAALQEIIDLHEQNIAMVAVIESQQKMLKQAQQEYIEQHGDGETDCVTPYDTYGLPKDYAKRFRHKKDTLCQ